MRARLRSLDRLIDRVPVSPRFFRFCVVGATGTVVNLAVLGLSHALLPAAWGNWQHRVAMALAIAISIFTNFLMHDAWTWGDRPKEGTVRTWFRRLGRFYVVSCAAASVQWLVAVLLYEQALERLLGTVGVYVAQAGGIAFALFINFGANHLWTFRSRKAADPGAPPAA